VASPPARKQSQNNNNNHHTASSNDSKKQDFQRYLDKSGVLDALTKVRLLSVDRTKESNSEWTGPRVLPNTTLTRRNKILQVLVGLYEEPERPSQPLDYIRRYLGAPTAVDVEGLQRENERLKRENTQLRQQAAQKKESSTKNTLAPPE
jgi:hypothetical protein